MDRRPLAPPHGFSQLATSFIAFRSLGIHHSPFISFAAQSVPQDGSAIPLVLAEDLRPVRVREPPAARLLDLIPIQLSMH